MAARKSITLKSLLALLCACLFAGCGGGSMTPTVQHSVNPASPANTSFSLAPDPNFPPGCVGVPVALNGFGGCPMNAYQVNIGRIWEFVDTFTTPHHLFVRQETAPGFDGVTGIVWHYSKADFSTGQRLPGDDGMGYWCPGDPTAELYFGLAHKDATAASPAGWYSTHQTYRCRGDIRTTDISGPGYLIVADYPGDTGPITYSFCSRHNVWIDDPTAWTPASCASPQIVGWETKMARDTANLPITIQSEGPQVLSCAPTGTIDCRFWAIEGWTFSGGDMQAIIVKDDGSVPKNPPAWLSMKLVSVKP